MKRVALVVTIIAVLTMFLASCNTYERCPAYTQATEQVEVSAA